MTLTLIYDRFGDRLAFWGGIGTQSTMPFGTPQEVREKVKEVQKILGKRGALVVAPTHILEPEVAWGKCTGICGRCEAFLLRINKMVMNK